MRGDLRHGGRRGLLAAAAAVLVVGGVLVVLLGLSAPAAGPPAAPPRTVTQSTPAPEAPPVAPSPTSTPGLPDAAERPGAPAAELGPVLPASDPIGLDIPSIAVHSDSLEALELDAEGVLPAPTNFARPGWYTGGPRPGQFGPAVIAGHVDGPDGPAVFYRLGELAVGAAVTVTRADGVVATFVVDSVERYAKAEFPTSRVYGNTTDRAEIRLITCGGAFDRTTGHYVDNIVVFGHLVA